MIEINKWNTFSRFSTCTATYLKLSSQSVSIERISVFFHYPPSEHQEKMIFFIGTALILLIYLYFKKSFSFWRNRGFPYAEPSIPMGNFGTIGFKEHFSEYMVRQYKNFKHKGPGFGIYIVTSPTLVVTDPELIKDVTIRNFEHFHERGFYVNEKADPLWHNLFTSSGQYWKDLRAKLSPTFTSGRMKMMFPIVSQTADRMVDYLIKLEQTRESIEVKEVYASYATEVIGNVAFGLDLECIGHPDNEFRQVTRAVFEPNKWQNLRITFIFALQKVAKFFNMGLNPPNVIDFFMSTVRQNLEYREKNNIQRNDFFQLLINIKNSNAGMSFNEIAANSFVFFAAG